MLSEYYQAATRTAALAEKDWVGIIKLTGSDRASWLQGMVTNDVQKVAPGAGCYAAHLTPQGKIIAHMQVLIDADALWLSLERAAIPKLLAAFDKLLIMEDVQMADVSDDYSILAVLGPQAPSALEAWTDEPLKLAGKYAHRKIDYSRIVVSELGYNLWVSREKEDKILHFLAQSGATAIDHGAWDVLRTEAGIPVYGVDIDETTTMPEIGEAGINYEKGCYIGQEVVAKVKYIGHVTCRFEFFAERFKVRYIEANVIEHAALGREGGPVCLGECQVRAGKIGSLILSTRAGFRAKCLRIPRLNLRYDGLRHIEVHMMVLDREFLILVFQNFNA